MDWFQSKTGQIIALVSIVGTLAGFGYTGATYVNRLENLEAKIGGVDEAEDEMKIIEERFASIETSVQFLEKEIDNIVTYQDNPNNPRHPFSCLHSTKLFLISKENKQQSIFQKTLEQVMLMSTVFQRERGNIRVYSPSTSVDLLVRVLNASPRKQNSQSKEQLQITK